MNWFLIPLKKYATFSGRARRKEFWMFYLISQVISILLMFLGGVTGVFMIVYYIFNLVILIPLIAVAVRRLHDTGRSGWWFLLSLTGIGLIVLIIFWALDSEPGQNKYGPNPKENSTDY
jgi:uncharacterized membrane protein YhaH (DUF805 family)